MKPKARRAYVILGIVAAVVAAAWGLHHWWTAGKESTDDAQVDADVVPLAGRVGGVIKTVKVVDHQQVKKGDVLFEIDPADLDVEVARTEAELEAAMAQKDAADAQVAVVSSSSSGGLSSAKAQLTGADASVRASDDMVHAAEASVARAKADLQIADTELNNAKTLFGKEAITKRELDRAQQQHDVSRAALDAANAQASNAREQKRLASSRVAEGFLIRTRADADTREARSGDTARREAAFASGAQFVSTDYQDPDPRFKTGYSVSLPGGGASRCNPVNAPKGCDFKAE